MTKSILPPNPVARKLAAQNLIAAAGRILVAVAAVVCCLACAATAGTFSFLPVPATTIPSNGDLNPYGVAFVPAGFPKGGIIQRGDFLVSNFNNSNNTQGQGSTIVSINPKSQTSLFFQGTPPLGLTNALGVAQAGFVFAGSVFTTDGTSNTVQPGPLFIFDKTGKVIDTLSPGTDLLNGPWGLKINDLGSAANVFVANAFSGDVVRLDVSFRGNSVTVDRAARIASGYISGPNPTAVVLGPAGLAYNQKNDTLYIASEGDNKIFSIANATKAASDAGMGVLVYGDPAHLHGPLGLVMAPNGDLLVANADALNVNPAQPSEIVEFTPQGKFVSEFSVDPANGGAFGLRIGNIGDTFYFAYVDDNASTLSTWTFELP